jgi:hypothetical protein
MNKTFMPKVEELTHDSEYDQFLDQAPHSPCEHVPGHKVF